MTRHQHAPGKCRQEAEDSPVGGSALGPKLLLSVPEAAELLGVSKRTVFHLLASGDLARRKVRRRTMIHRDDVFRFATGVGVHPQKPGTQMGGEI